MEQRYETVCNIALAEANHLHAMRKPDLKAQMTSFLDSQIEMHRDMLGKLERARAAVDEM